MDSETELERFAARVLEFDAVLALVADHGTNSLARRSVRELGPRGENEARRALQRVREMGECLAREDAPSPAGVTDPFPEKPEGRLDEDRIAAIRDFLDANTRLKRWAAEREELIPETAALLAASPDTTEIFERIERVVDERGRIKTSASGKLERMRREITGLGSRVDGLMREIANRSDVRASPLRRQCAPARRPSRSRGEGQDVRARQRARTRSFAIRRIRVHRAERGDRARESPRRAASGRATRGRADSHRTDARHSRLQADDRWCRIARGRDGGRARIGALGGCDECQACAPARR